MLAWLVLAFTALPLIELYLLIQVGQLVGGGATLLLVLLTGIVGAALARTQGWVVLRDLQRASSEGRVPALELVQGAMVVVGGLMLVTPGILTDVVGLSIMIPPVRRAAAGAVARWLRRRVEVQVTDFGRPRGAERRVPGSQQVVDAEVRHVDEEEPGAREQAPRGPRDGQ